MLRLHVAAIKRFS